MKTINMENQMEKAKTILLFIIKAIIVFLFIAWNTNIMAQDTIVFKDGAYVTGKIKEVTSQTVTVVFQSYAGETISSYDVLTINAIKYQNGYYEKIDQHIPKGYYVDNSFNLRERVTDDVVKIGEKEMFNRMMDANNIQINDYLNEYRYSKKMQKVMIAPAAGFAAGTVGFMMLGILGGFAQGSDDFVNGTMYASAGCFALANISVGTSFYLNAKKKNNKKAAIKMYNEMYSSNY